MINQTPTPGSHFTAPLRIEAGDPTQTLTAIVASMDNQTGGTADTVDYTIADVSTVVTGVDGTGNNAASKADVDTRLGTINDNLATIVALIDVLLERIQ